MSKENPLAYHKLAKTEEILEIFVNQRKLSIITHMYYIIKEQDLFPPPLDTGVNVNYLLGCVENC
jgi:hypothetical protein